MFVPCHPEFPKLGWEELTAAMAYRSDDSIGCTEIHKVCLADRMVYVVVCATEEARRFQEASNIAGEAMGPHGCWQNVEPRELYIDKHATGDWETAPSSSAPRSQMGNSTKKAKDMEELLQI